MGIHFHNVEFKYSKKASKNILSNINIQIQKNDEFVMIVGHTGSGKSTLVQHMNALLLPTKGHIDIYDKTVKPKSKLKLKLVRSKIGLVFQFPEYQLFEDTVIKDIEFGPKNFGKSKEEARNLAKKASEQIEVPEEMFEKSPFNLSGGQMRRVAIAGILASEPEILILDEPTVGLDPKGKDNLMNLLVNLQKETHKSIVMITHDMNAVARYSKRVIVMNKGDVVLDGTPQELFNNEELLEKHNLSLPECGKYAKVLKEKGLIDYKDIPLTKEELLKIITKEEDYE